MDSNKLNQINDCILIHYICSVDVVYRNMLASTAVAVDITGR